MYKRNHLHSTCNATHVHAVTFHHCLKHEYPEEFKECHCTHVKIYNVYPIPVSHCAKQIVVAWIAMVQHQQPAVPAVYLFKGNDLTGQKFASIATEFTDQGNYLK